jgi:hypothetical protein
VIWYFADGATPIGPLELSELKKRLEDRGDLRSVLVWRDGFSDWQKASEISELKDLFVKPPPIPKSSIADNPLIDRLAALARVDVAGKDADRAKGQGSNSKSRVKTAIFWIVGVPFVILAASLGGVIGKAAIQLMMALRADPSGANLDDAQLKKLLDEGHQVALNKLRPTLPKKIDEITTMVAATARDGTVYYYFRVDRDMKDFANVNFVGTMRKTIKKDACMQTQFKKSLNLGAKYEYSYVDKHGRQIGSLIIDKGDCP